MLTLSTLSPYGRQPGREPYLRSYITLHGQEGIDGRKLINSRKFIVKMVPNVMAASETGVTVTLIEGFKLSRSPTGR
jgi:hypothetical protein